MKKTLLIATAMFLLCALVLSILPNQIPLSCFGFSREVDSGERALRLRLVTTATDWLGASTGDDTHRSIIDLYNTLDPLPVEYTVTYTDAWCAAFVSAAAMKCGLTDIIPPECSCPRQVTLFQSMNRWQEADSYVPLPGDIIYYNWDLQQSMDCTATPDHVGIVVGTFGPFIRVMEGNCAAQARFHTIFRNHWTIRGYGLPDYTSISKTNAPLT